MTTRLSPSVIGFFATCFFEEKVGKNLFIHFLVQLAYFVIETRERI
jgi:hypothetical protein